MDYNNEPSKIMFKDEEFQRPRSFQATTPKIVELVIKYSGGAIKNARQVNYVLIGFVAVEITIPLFLFFNAGLGTPTNQTTIDKTIKLHSPI